MVPGAKIEFDTNTPWYTRENFTLIFYADTSRTHQEKKNLYQILNGPERTKLLNIRFVPAPSEVILGSTGKGSNKILDSWIKHTTEIKKMIILCTTDILNLDQPLNKDNNTTMRKYIMQMKTDKGNALFHHIDKTQSFKDSTGIT